MKWNVVLLAICCTVLLACKPGDNSAGVLPADQDILSKAYDPHRRVPDGFLVDERANTDGSYTIYHVKDVSASYELCTDNFDDALAWEAADNTSRAVNGVFVGTYENDRYFEVIRDLAYPDGVGNIPDATSPGFSRVFKCSYVNRDGADRTLRDGYAGTLHAEPLSAASLKRLVEYLWQFTYFGSARKTVVDSYATDQGEHYRHTLLLALVTRRGFEQCDLVEVIEWYFSVSKQSGELSKEFNKLYEFGAELQDGVPQRCEE